MSAFREQGAWCTKIHGNEYMASGLPDIIGVWEGYFFAVETKMPGKEGNTSARQDYVHGKIKRAGGICIVSSSPQDALTRVRDAIDARASRRRA